MLLIFLVNNDHNILNVHINESIKTVNLANLQRAAGLFLLCIAIAAIYYYIKTEKIGCGNHYSSLRTSVR